MRDQDHFCLMSAEIIGGASLEKSLGPLESQHALERVLRRITLALEAYQAEILERSTQRILAVFLGCEQAVQSASEIIDRIANLPPFGGNRLSVRVAIHFDNESNPDKAQSYLLKLLNVAREEETLVSATAIEQLPQTIRHLAKHEEQSRNGIEGGFYSITRQAHLILSQPPQGLVEQTPPRLEVRYKDQLIYMDRHRPTVLIGRESGNDIVIQDPRVSRQHCRIELSRGEFSLVDYSSNGSYLVHDEGNELHLHKTKGAIGGGSGKIGCGFSPSKSASEPLFFEFI